jgi:hypothetical protein
MPKLPIASSPRPPSSKKGTYVASLSNQHPTDQQVDAKKKGANNKEVPIDSGNPDKKLRISTCLDAK